MDTDDLSINAYNAIIIEAEKFHHDLTLQFGLLSSKCLNEEEYLTNSQKMIDNWLLNWDLKELTEEIFYENQPEETEFKKCLKRICDNIDNVKKIPIENREFDEW